jgi:hypothetical protein
MSHSSESRRARAPRGYRSSLRGAPKTAPPRPRAPAKA